MTLLCGCSLGTPEGYESMKSARELYEKLDGARVIMEDLTSGEQLMEFSFYINANDEMIFDYSGTTDEGEERGYSNGAEFYYKTADADGWRVIGSADESYIYNIYNREYRYPYATGNIFFLDATSVSEAAVTENADGGMTISYTYDADKLNSYATSLLDNVESFSSLRTDCVINADGYITEFTEVGSVTDENGEEADVNMKITVTDMNEVYEIPYPVGNIIKD
jgi:hypothetical protein